MIVESIVAGITVIIISSLRLSRYILDREERLIKEEKAYNDKLIQEELELQDMIDHPEKYLPKPKSIRQQIIDLEEELHSWRYRYPPTDKPNDKAGRAENRMLAIDAINKKIAELIKEEYK